MAVTLTPRAITEICSDNYSEDLKPVLQVIELKLVQSQQHSNTERFRLFLSDGSIYQQGMLFTQKNELVHSGRLQKGSVVILTQFICNSVQGRQILIVVDVDVILDKCELFGEPIAPKGNPSASSVYSSIYNSGSSYSSNAPPTYPKADPGLSLPRSALKVNTPASSVHSSIYNSGSSYSSNAPPTYPKAEPGVGLPVFLVLELKLVQSQQDSNTDWFRLVLSDGSLYRQARLATHKNELVYSGRLQKGSVVRLTQFIHHVVHSREMMIIIDLDIVEECEQIGVPVAAPNGALAESATGQSGVTSGEFTIFK